MKQRARSGTIGLLFFIGTMTLLFAGCSATRAGSPQVALFGDSLAWEAQPYYDELAHAAGDVPHTYDTYGGTAICDWLTRMAEVEAQYHPKAIELEFSGNNLTPCMEGYEVYTPQYYEKYRVDTMSAIQIFTVAGLTSSWLVRPLTETSSRSGLAETQHAVPGDRGGRSGARHLRRRRHRRRATGAHVHRHPPVPGTRVVHWASDRRGALQRGPLGRWRSLLSDREGQRLRGDRRMPGLFVRGLPVCHGDGQRADREGIPRLIRAIAHGRSS
jgi:hypothetical protein